MRINSLKFTVLILASHLKGVKRISNKNLTIDERNLTSTQWVEYHVGTKRKSYNSLPTSNITAEAVTVDGLTLSQTDNAGVTTTNGRSYTASGMIHTRTDGRGNTTTTVTDKAGRTLTVTDAAGNVTTTVYGSAHDLPAMVTDAQGNTSCYRYDVRGRKFAEWGTGIQPVCFGYDDADRMTSLTTFRAGTETVSTDPSNRTDGDTTTWSYHDASGMETAKTYADNTSVLKTYDAYNRVLTETDARGKVKAHTYEQARGLLLGTSYNDSTTPRAYTYNHLGQRTQVTDAAGVRTLSYNSYGEQESDSLVAGSAPHLITETRDDKGRSTGYTYSKNGAVQQTVTTGYGSDGRITSAGFLHGGEEKVFSYEYLAGTHLLEKLTMPNDMSLTQSYELHSPFEISNDYCFGYALPYNADNIKIPYDQITLNTLDIMKEWILDELKKSIMKSVKSWTVKYIQTNSLSGSFSGFLMYACKCDKKPHLNKVEIIDFSKEHHLYSVFDLEEQGLNDFKRNATNLLSSINDSFEKKCNAC